MAVAGASPHGGARTCPAATWRVRAITALVLVILARPAEGDELDFLFEPAPVEGEDSAARVPRPTPAPQPTPPATPASVAASETGASASGPGAADPEPRMPPGRAIEEVIVTAQRRAERLQDVPVSVTAFSEDVIDQRDIAGVADLEHATPGFVYAHVGGAAQPTIRGVGSDIFTAAGEPGVALYVDDVYVGRKFVPHAALVGIERIEVLRGPQGTLYGRNTSGGALKFVTRRPTDELEASLGVQRGAFDQWLGRGSVSAPILEERLRARLSFHGEDRDGWVRDLTNGGFLEAQRVGSLRLAADSEPLDWLRIGVTTDVTRQHDTGPVAFPLSEGFAQQAGGQVSDDPREIYTDFPADGDVSSDGVALDVQGDFAFGTATLIASVRRSDRKLLWDLDGTDYPLYQFDLREDGDQGSVEAQYAFDWEPPIGTGPVDVLAGFFFYDEGASQVFDIRTFAVEGVGDFLFLARPDTTSYAGFAHAGWPLHRWLTLRLGGRYTLDRKETWLTIRSPVPGESCEDLRVSDSFDAFTGLVGVDVPLDDDRLLYASFSQGFKAGGFNTGGCRDLRYDPELVDAFEAGLKSEWLGGLLRVNVAGFVYAFDGIQVEQIDGFSSKVVNAARAGIRGVELETTVHPFAGRAWLDGVSLDGNATWLDARYDEFTDDDALTPTEGPIDLSGNRLPKSPEWAGSVGFQYRLPVGSLASLLGRFEWGYRTRQFFTQFNDPRFAQAAYDVKNLFVSLDLESGQGGIRTFVKNLDDDAILNGGFTSIAVGGGLGYYAPPRIWGAELYGRF